MAILTPPKPKGLGAATLNSPELASTDHDAERASFANLGYQPNVSYADALKGAKDQAAETAKIVNLFSGGSATPTTTPTAATPAVGGAGTNATSSAGGATDVAPPAAGGAGTGGYAELLAAEQARLNGLKTPSYTAADTSTYDQKLAAINDPNYRAEEFAKKEAEAIASIQQQYDQKRNDARRDAENAKASRFSDLAGIGVNPLSSGSVSVANENKSTLDRFLSNIDIEQGAAMAQARAAIRGEKTAAQDKDLAAAKEARQGLIDQADKTYQLSRDQMNDLMSQQSKIIDLAKSGYDLSKEQKKDAADSINTLVDQFGIDYLEQMAPQDKRALEKAAGLKIGELDTRAAALRKENTRKTTEATAKDNLEASRDQQSKLITQGYLPLSPSDLAGVDKSQIISINGQTYLKPPTKLDGVAAEYDYYKQDQKSRGLPALSFNEYQTADANRKARAAGGGSGGGSTSNSKLASAAATANKALMSGESWGSVYNRLKTQFPAASNQELDSLLDSRFKEKGAYQAFNASTKKPAGGGSLLDLANEED